MPIEPPLDVEKTIREGCRAAFTALAGDGLSRQQIHAKTFELAKKLEVSLDGTDTALAALTLHALLVRQCVASLQRERVQ